MLVLNTGMLYKSILFEILEDKADLNVNPDAQGSQNIQNSSSLSIERNSKLEVNFVIDEFSKDSAFRDKPIFLKPLRYRRQKGWTAQNRLLETVHVTKHMQYPKFMYFILTISLCSCQFYSYYTTKFARKEISFSKLAGLYAKITFSKRITIVMRRVRNYKVFINHQLMCNDYKLFIFITNLESYIFLQNKMTS